MATKTLSKVKATVVANGEKPNLPKTLEVLQFLRTAHGSSDGKIHTMLDLALSEVSSVNMELMLQRLMLHIGDVSRQHNILREMGVKSENGGAQERAIFRSILRWWEKAMPESFEKNLRVFAEFTLYENLMYFELRTDRKTGSLTGKEILFPMPEKVQEFLAAQIRAGKDTNLIARHLPKYETGKNRTTTKIAKCKEGKTEYNWTLPVGKSWVKVNGVRVEGEKVTLKTGDVITYPRDKQTFTIERQAFINTWIKNFCKVMGWSINDYKEFRKLQNTPEQWFSSKEIENMPKSDFMKMLDGLTSGQRFRVAKTVAYKDGNTLVSKEKWGDLGKWYIEWEKSQEKVADKLRQAAANGDEVTKEKLMKEFKVKSTGIKTTDLLVKIFNGGLTEMQIDNTYQSMVEKMDLIANVFPIVDGSGSMDNSIMIDGVRLSLRQVAYAMAIAFSTRNPVESFRNTLGWFSDNFHIIGHSRFKDFRPNPYVSRSRFVKEVDNHQVLSETKTFTENLRSLAGSDPGEVASTNIGAAIDYFMDLVKSGKFHVEDLPNALLFITDNEHNEGTHPKDALAKASKIGWNPLVVFWGLTNIPSHMMAQYKDTPNCLLVSGFNESVLSQVLRGIKSGSIDPQDELWSIFEDKRYSVLN